MRKAFTLIELLISIIILSIMMLFLYKSYSQLNISNKVFEGEVENVSAAERLKKTIYLDFSVSLAKSVKILKQDPKEDVVFLQTNNSVHDRINPYIAYIVKDKVLYRLESLKEFKEFPLAVDSEFVADKLGKVKIFRVYQSRDTKKSIYLVDILFENEEEILLKVNALNS